MCTFCYTPYIGCPKGRRHYYLQWLKCKTAIKNGHSYCPIGESTEVRELQKLSGNVLACPFHTHIAIQQIEFEFRQRDEVPSPIDSSDPSSPTTSNTTYVASDDESEIEFSQAGQKSLHRPSSTAVYLDLRFPKPGPIKRHKSATTTKTETRKIQRSTGRSQDSQSEPNTAIICVNSVPRTSSSSSSSSSKRGPVISPGLPASPAAYRQNRSQPQTQLHAKLTLKALTEVDESKKELKSANKLSEPACCPPSPPPPEIITTLPTPVDQGNPSNPDLLTRRLGPSTTLTITITKAPKLNIQKITSSKSEPDLKSTSKGLESSNSTTTSTSHTFDSFLTPSGTLQPDSNTANTPTTTTKTSSSSSSSSSLRSRSGSLFTRLKDGTTTTLHHSALSRTLSASTTTTNTNRRRQASATHPKNVAPWDQVLLPASISKPVNLEVGVNASTRKPTNLAVDEITNCTSSETKAIEGHLQERRLGGQGPRTAPLPAEMEAMMSRLESVGVGVGLGIGLGVVTRDTDEGKFVSGHKRSCSATMLQRRMGIGLGGLRKKSEGS
ncbi:uncharacterized protein NCU09712 [Neurospora crassa OR74A]|uniref:Uncharacterized protein n=1 Tax=Neurospora crassa (strain ATCC 24698 / 74-OR23-1A / CBS 708.71 / DSM 1257 / FGSC 987) TaxID=367110 RepID=V5ILD6_NEUCR|nr:hypothetical protein NCU09712 [Neurospora crassa OR74A]XP_011395307.1 uncharacterized protein NCU09712 [Neurospora crassa OR74A]ESA41884.1 hypothetical protein NCU09712 [Neurospora crassa OR74A]ESA41885.1 hypothetical protein, variant [Neurospora crassa OR74A]|eukprot:XP_011395306.1 hypothetical protein NCU09712 [Neurospora crassa OR74A]